MFVAIPSNGKVGVYSGGLGGDEDTGFLCLMLERKKRLGSQDPADQYKAAYSPMGYHLDL